MQNKVTYQVRAVYYQHNDGRANNGYYTLKRNYNTLEEARVSNNEIKAHMKAMGSGDEEITAHYHWIYEEFGIDGFMHKPLGIFKITEEHVED